MEATERARTLKERRRAERVASLRGVQLPSLQEARAMSVVRLRDALWNAGYPARGLPSPAEARQLTQDELRAQLQQAKVRFLSQLQKVLVKAPPPEADEAERDGEA
ncbi:unnamed protein product [Effrenium voratum]|nr:unnamed protein product [Effrenium voratum]